MECEKSEPAGEMTHFFSLSLIIKKVFENM